ncbi:TonB-dependent receptor [Sphingomonas hengshuiensis]|uniref:TonB-dependent receptor n=1 Tax=Sphingomonas hengshuiensis TaxID=1609977 RepID=A0A7U4J7N1_9SPHN|nr:TonB-dependent receptor [Sphingomonas hengshuiensis]AJP71771.1 TonB-dependent receptor [Sphingomonas hengshuiensis]
MKQALWIASSALALAASQPALAQDVVARDPDTIVVTAQKREQDLLDVPQSVSVVSGATLERQQAVTFQDYAKLIPGLQLEQSNPGEARIVLRGINTGGVASTVSTYIDETPFGSSSGQNNGAILAGEFDTFDVTRIEVLRGPQGTLYGASSLGGVVKFVTNLPDTAATEGRARATIETTEGGDLSYMGQAMLNLPVSEKLAIRGSGFYRSYGGYIDSIGTGGSDVAENINGSKSYGGRLSALFVPTETLSVRLSAVLQDFDSKGGSVVDADPATLAPLYGLTQSQFVPEFTKVKYRLYNGTLNLDLGGAELLSSTSYAVQDVTLRDDLTTPYGAALGVPSDIGMAQMTNLTKWTQEVRLQSPTSSSVEWLVGGYYTHEKGGIFQRIDLLTPGTLSVDPAMPQVADIFTTSTYQEVAGFGNATVHLGPRFDLTLGGRYSHNKQFADQGGTGLLAPEALDSRSSENVFTWSGAAKYSVSDTASLYARVAKGFRPGGPNLLPPGVPAGTPRTYGSDSLISYEVGVKAQTADNSFSIDAAAFHIDWTDIQLFTVINGFGLNANGGKAKSEGFEFTATLRPTRGFVVAFNGAYTRARLTSDTDPNVGGLAGDPLPFTPEFNWNVNADYSWTLAGETEAFVGASLRALSKQRANFDAGFGAAFALDRPTLPAYEVIDLRAGVDFGRFTLDVYAKNVANSRGVTDVTTGGGLPVAPNGAITTGIVRPRTFGLSLGAGF